MADPGANGGFAIVPLYVGQTVDRRLVNSNKKLPIAPLCNHVIWISERQPVDNRSAVEFDVVENAAVGSRDSYKGRRVRRNSADREPTAVGAEGDTANLAWHTEKGRPVGAPNFRD